MRPSAASKNGCHRVDRELDALLGVSKRELSSEARRHIHQCQRCAALYEWAIGELTSSPVSGDVQSQIQATLVANLKTVTPAGSMWTRALRFALVVIVLGVAALGFLGPNGARVMISWQWIGAGIALLIGTVLLSVSLAWQVIPGSLHRFPAHLAIGTAASAFAGASLLLFPWDAAASSVAQGRACLGTGLMLAAPAALAFLLLARRGAVLNRVMVGTTVGAMSGLFGVSVLQFHCPILEASHIVIWHGGVLLISIAAGVAIGYSITYFQRLPGAA
jgi:hypothetical protein